MTVQWVLSSLVALIVPAVSFTSPSSLVSRGNNCNAKRTSSQLQVQTDPTTISTKDYYDLVGGDIFEEDELRRKIEFQDHIYPKHVEVIKDIAPVAEKMVDDILLETGEKSWQPQDMLPDFSKEGWEDELKEMRKMAAVIPDDLLVVLIGDMVTEEALPTYQTLLNTFEGCDDPTGTSENAWAKWSRGWTSEENRHGDLLNKYLFLGGRCNMRSIEVTIQHLITNGFNPDARMDPYRGFVYTSFQERATKISHGNVGKLAKEYGEANLQKICSRIAGDEARHEKAYQKFSEEILERDPDGLLVVFGDMMRGQIAMPAEQMTDGVDPKLYDSFSQVAQNLGVYTALDYADILDHLIKRWKIEHLTGLSPRGEEEQQYLCNLPRRFRKLAERTMNKKKKLSEDKIPLKSFDWIYGRKVRA